MQSILTKLIEHRCLDSEEACQVMHGIARGAYPDAQIAALLTTFLMRSISVDELRGFHRALLELALPVNLDNTEVIDIVGTGGDGKNTFNISTAACFVVAAAGYPVVKHGNYGATSVSGASNVMEQHSVRFTTDVDRLRRSLDGCNLAYLHAPLFNPAMKAVAGVRKALGVRTLFNVLGPLVNPVRPKYQLLGVYNLPLLRLYNYVAQADGQTLCVAHSLDGYDEISLTAPFKVADGGMEHVFRAEDFGLTTVQPADLYGGNTPVEACRIFDAVMHGTATSAQREVVAVNAAFAIRTRCPEKTVEDCLNEAFTALDSGRALDTLNHFIRLNQ